MTDDIRNNHVCKSSHIPYIWIKLAVKSSFTAAKATYLLNFAVVDRSLTYELYGLQYNTYM